MHHFQYKNDILYCEDVAVSEIVSRVGSPCYIYSSATLKRHFRAFDEGFAGIGHLTCFAVKSCSNIAILNLFAGLGGGADIVSGGELFRALKAGVPGNRILYSGVGKSRREMREALSAGILMFNVESTQELDRLNETARSMNMTAPVAFRVNPDVDPETHAYISTGLAKNKFGIGVDEALGEYERAAAMSHIDVIGVSCHIGSQLTKLDPFLETLRKLKNFIARLAERNIIIRHLDLGGGVGITYRDEEPPHPRDYARAILQELGDTDITLFLEPGRVLVGNGGILVTEVQYTKLNTGGDQHKRFIIVDAAMNDITRPSMYGAYHAILPVRRTDGDEHVVDIVGPICESGDFLAKDRMFPEVRQGDLLAVMSAGAYGFTMASNYNSRPRTPEILVDGENFTVIRERETYEDLIRGEHIPAS